MHDCFIQCHNILSDRPVVIADEITLHIPDLDLEPDVNLLLSDAKTVEELEQCVMNWQTHITIVIEEQQSKKPQVCDFPYTYNDGTVYTTNSN